MSALAQIRRSPWREKFDPIVLLGRLWPQWPIARLLRVIAERDCTPDTLREILTLPLPPSWHKLFTRRLDNASAEDKSKASDDFAAAHAAWATASTDHEKLAYEYRAAQTNHAARVEIAKNLFDTATYPEYQRALAAFEERLEAERQTVDRIAYCGKVPVAVYGASAGGYIIADKDSNGKIIGKFVADPDFRQYKKAVGRVNRVMAEAASAHLVEAINSADVAQFVGMAEIAVMTH